MAALATVFRWLAGAAAAAAVALPCAAQAVSRASVSSAGQQAASDSYAPVVSSDGRFVVFHSRAWNLAPGDTDSTFDVFLHDRADGSTELMSVDSSGVQLAAANEDPSVSGDGLRVAFESWTVPFPGYNMTALLLRDRQAGTTRAVAVHSFGGAFRASLSADGGTVLLSTDEELAFPDNNGVHDVYAYDVASAVFARVSVATGGTEANAGSAWSAASGDGRRVAFDSAASNLVPGDTNGRQDVFLRDLGTGTTTRVSVGPGGVEANGDSRLPAISADGRYVAFESFASNLVPGDTNLRMDVFLHDTQTGTTSRVSVSSAGTEAGEDCTSPGISGDGRHVVFTSAANDLVPGDTNGTFDVFVRDVFAGTTARASVSSTGTQGDGASHGRALSADGAVVAFHSRATNLVAADTNGRYDVFVRDGSLTCPATLTYCTAKPNSLGCWPEIGFSGLPTLSGHDAFRVTAANVLNSKSGIFLWSASPAAVPFKGGTLCVGTPIKRTAAQTSGGSPPSIADCSGTYSFHFGHAYATSQSLAVGTGVYGQYWSRDQGHAPPNNVGLTDAVYFQLCP